MKKSSSPKIKLPEEYKINIYIIDYQHEELLALYKKIESPRMEQNSFYEIFLELNNFFYTHFKTEEKFMQYINYPYFKEHKKEHDALLKEYRSILENGIKNADLVKTEKEIKKLLLQWIYAHYDMKTGIDGGDIKLIKYVKSHIGQAKPEY